ncbi:MAG: GIY-YIG nuclease family protein [Arcobacter sp.]|nr:GIY-YIG nuclease family protein [Arcobacter sp.]
MACIYIIRHKESNNSYIGSTTDFNKRILKHKSDCFNVNGNGFQKKLYQFIRDNGGWDNFDMVKICDCEKKERKIMEQENIDKIKPTLNDMRAYGVNKYIVSLQKRRHYNKNKDEMNLRSIKWRKENRERYRTIKHKCYEKNKHKYHKKILCECGREITIANKPRHLKSNIHHSLLHHSKHHQT